MGKYDATAAAKNSGKYGMTANVTPTLSPINVTAGNFSVGGQSTPTAQIAPVEAKQPFPNTKTGIALNTLKGLVLPTSVGDSPYFQTAKNLVQGIARSLGSIGLSAGKAMGVPAPAQMAPTDYSGNLQKLFTSVYGNEPVKNLQTRVEENKKSIENSPFAQSTGLAKFAGPLAFAGVTADTVLLLPVGGEGEIIDQLAKESNSGEIYNMLRKINIPEEVATKMAPQFALTKDSGEIKSLFEATKGLVGSKLLSGDTSGIHIPTDYTPENMGHEAYNQMINDAQSSSPQNTVQQTVDDILNGDLKVRTSPDLKTEKLSTLGRGKYASIFRNDPNFDTLDSIASNIGVSTDELLTRIADEAAARKSSALPETTLPRQPSTAEKLLHTDYNGIHAPSYDPTIDPTTGLVKPPSVRGGLTPPELNFSKWNDKSTFSLARETLQRNIEKIAPPEDVAKINDFLINPIRHNETERITFTNDLKNTIRGLVDDLGIKAGSKEDRLVQQYGEKMINRQELAALSPDKHTQIEEAANFFRNTYDHLLDKVNAARSQYGYAPIPKREDYFRHFNDITNVINQMGYLFREQDLPTEISGITNIFKPGKPFSTAELARKGNQTSYSAIKGMDNYVESISKQIYHIDSVQRVRALEKYIRLAGPSGEAKLPAFVANLAEHGNLLAGKKALLDRSVESVVGRRFFRAATALKSQSSTSMVLGNVASAFTNSIPFTQSLATTEKLPFMKGLLESMITPFKGKLNTIDGVTSEFLTRRYPDGKIAPSLGEKTANVASWLFKTIDEFTGKAVVSGKYYEALGKGMQPEAAMKVADDYAGRVLTDRSWGQLPTLFQTKSAGFLTQFQTEVNNQYSFLRHDIPQLAGGNKTKIVGSLAQFVLYSYLFDNAYQSITGRRPTLDPIYAGLTLLGQTDVSKHLPLKSRAVTAAQDVVGNLPFGNLIPLIGTSGGGRFPIMSSLPDLTKLSQGQLTELLNPVSLQLKKTIQGAETVAAGKATTPTGKVKFRVPQTTENWIKGLLFGPSSLSGAQKYYQQLDQKAAGVSTTKRHTY